MASALDFKPAEASNYKVASHPLQRTDNALPRRHLSGVCVDTGTNDHEIASLYRIVGGVASYSVGQQPCTSDDVLHRHQFG